MKFSQAIYIFNVNIAVYTKKCFDNKIYFEYYYYYNIPNSEYSKDLLILIYDKNLEHYYQIIYNNSNIQSNNNQYNIKNENKNKNVDQELTNEIYKLIQKYKKMSIYDNDITKNVIKSNND